MQRSIFHLIHFWVNGDDALVHNVRLVDGGQQFLKSSPGGGTVDGVEVSCSAFLMTDAGRDNVWGYGPQDGQTTCYTGGIDTHETPNWAVRDSVFEGIYCDASGVERPAHGRFPEMRDNMTYNGGLSEHGVHMWDSEEGSGHVIERNQFINCGRGIGLGFNGEVYGSTVVNNMVFSAFSGGGEHDVGISVERGVDTTTMRLGQRTGLKMRPVETCTLPTARISLSPPCFHRLARTSTAWNGQIPHPWARTVAPAERGCPGRAAR